MDHLKNQGPSDKETSHPLLLRVLILAASVFKGRLKGNSGCNSSPGKCRRPGKNLWSHTFAIEASTRSYGHVI
jgi:hypothetical protein